MRGGVNLVIVSFSMRICPLAGTLYSLGLGHSRSHIDHTDVHTNKKGTGLDFTEQYKAPPLKLYQAGSLTLGRNTQHTRPVADHSARRTRAPFLTACLCTPLLKISESSAKPQFWAFPLGAPRGSCLVHASPTAALQRDFSGFRSGPGPRCNLKLVPTRYGVRSSANNQYTYG